MRHLIFIEKFFWEIQMSSFTELWQNHPNVKGDTPILDRKTYENQCAINLSVCLIRSGLQIKNYKGVLSWQEGAPKYPIRAQELADWLSGASSTLRSQREVYTGKNFMGETGVNGKTGVVFFKNYWGAGNKGDHIDLWNGYRLTLPRSIIQIYLRFGNFGLGSDYKNSEQVWFWSVP